MTLPTQWLPRRSPAAAASTRARTAVRRIVPALAVAAMCFSRPIAVVAAVSNPPVAPPTAVEPLLEEALLGDFTD